MDKLTDRQIILLRMAAHKAIQQCEEDIQFWEQMMKDEERAAKYKADFADLTIARNILTGESVDRKKDKEPQPEGMKAIEV